jgi:glycosyltransferase involved in cell wall biosynthesis
VRSLITVILLCYKQENFVGEAVRGVLAQTYSPLEVIIFDDCSPDRTAAIIERTIKDNPTRHQVQFIRNFENVGANVVVRRGLKVAKGEFIFVSHGDDVMLPDMVEEMAQALVAENLSLVTANAFYIDQNSQPLNRTFRDLAQPVDDSFETLARDGSNACCFGPAIGFDRAIYEKFDWVPPYLHAFDMMYPFYAYLLKGARFINKPLIKYRVHAANTSVSLQLEKSNPSERALTEEFDYHIHIAHALLMEEVLDRVLSEDSARYGAVAKRIKPLLTIQLSEMAKKLARVSRQSGTLYLKTREAER